MRYRLIAFLLLSAWGLQMAAADAPESVSDPLLGSGGLEQLSWMSEQFPPFNYADESGVARGIVTDTLVEMYRHLGRDFPVERVAFLPWARSYARLQREPGTALFSMVYTEPRQQLFRFVGPVITTRVVILARKAQGLQVERAADLSRLRIGAVRDDIGAQLLMQLGIDEQAIHLGSRVEHLIRQVQRGRLDAIAYSDLVARWQIKNLGADPADFESIYLLQEGALGIAFHRDTPEATLSLLQGALDQVAASGTLETIVQRYLE